MRMSENETPETENNRNRRKRLQFRSWHRGTREMDLLLGTFADQEVQGFGESELQAYEDLLTQNDPDLYNWMTGREAPPANIAECPVFKKLAQHRFAGNISQ